jgi:hypothetical protein
MPRRRIPLQPPWRCCENSTNWGHAVHRFRRTPQKFTLSRYFCRDHRLAKSIMQTVVKRLRPTPEVHSGGSGCVVTGGLCLLIHLDAV